MWNSKILASVIVVVYFLFVFFQFKGNEVLAGNLEVLIIPLMALAYMCFVNKKTVYFTLFILLYAISDLLDLIVNHIDYNYYYYLGNGLYMLAYMFLLIKLLKSISLYYVIKNLKLQLVVLLALSLYLFYVLQVIVEPFVGLRSEYYVELVYNALMLMLLTLALLNYNYRENQKSLFIFIGSLLIVFSEVIWIAHTYIAERNLLNVVSVTLKLSAFFFFYKQSKMMNEGSKEDELILE
ncbi:hypothetical protein [Tamlana sp. I1]|uniref:hypothetical protein n=1 Tax=Tamlana sp. I1 TaxID=2762061 RepID=UPI00188ECA1E|nr:hypothetical protein [Tamlana sp. I1]